MSVFASKSSMLSTRPSIREQRNGLIISTGHLTAFFTLFLNIRKTLINISQRKVFIYHRVAWFFSSAVVIDFDDISHVDYGYDSFGTGWGLSASGYGRQDEVETFSISIVTRDHREHFVCSFHGDGASCTGWSGVLLGDDSLIDFMGTQEDESRKLVKYLSKLLGVTVGRPIEATVDMRNCEGCGHKVSVHTPKCLYCGAEFLEADMEVAL